MVQLKKIIGILLALCFLMSITVATVSAHEEREGNFVWKQVKHVDWKHGQKIVWFTWEKVWVGGGHYNHWKPNHHWRPNHFAPEHNEFHHPPQNHPAPHHPPQNH